MVIQNVLFKARLEGISEIQPDIRMKGNFDIRCPDCGTVHEKEIYLVPEDTYKKSKYPTAFEYSMNCETCANHGTICVIDIGITPYESSEEFRTFILCDVRNLVIETGRPGDGFKVITETDKSFDCVDLSQGDGCEYDEDAGTVVGIYDIMTQVT